MNEQNKWFGIRYWGLNPWGRHSLVLMVAGLVYAFIGASYAFTNPPPSRTVALSVALKWLPLQNWGYIFIVAGLVAMLSSRWPPGVIGTWGYTILTGLSAGWAAVYGLGILFTASPWANVTGLLLWGLIGFMWWAISGLVNPDAVMVVSRGTG